VPVRQPANNNERQWHNERHEGEQSGQLSPGAATEGVQNSIAKIFYDYDGTTTKMTLMQFVEWAKSSPYFYYCQLV